jgi:hypothetical protein
VKPWNMANATGLRVRLNRIAGAGDRLGLGGAGGDAGLRGRPLRAHNKRLQSDVTAPGAPSGGRQPIFGHASMMPILAR